MQRILTQDMSTKLNLWKPLIGHIFLSGSEIIEHIFFGIGISPPVLFFRKIIKNASFY